METESGGGADLPGLGAERCSAVDRLAYGLEFVVGLRPVHTPHPIRRTVHRPIRQVDRAVAPTPPAQAGPGPILGMLDQVGAQWVTFDVTKHDVQVIVGFDRKRFVAVLPHVSAAVIVSVISPDVRGGQPLHPPT